MSDVAPPAPSPNLPVRRWFLPSAVTSQLDPDHTGHGGRPRRASAGTRVAVLNDREREVAVAVGRGWSNAGIGTGLLMSVATVKTHVSRILAKLGLTNRVQIALLAYDADLLPEDDR